MTKSLGNTSHYEGETIDIYSTSFKGYLLCESKKTNEIVCLYEVDSLEGHIQRGKSVIIGEGFLEEMTCLSRAVKFANTEGRRGMSYSSIGRREQCVLGHLHVLYRRLVSLQGEGCKQGIVSSGG